MSPVVIPSSRALAVRRTEVIRGDSQGTSTGVVTQSISRAHKSAQLRYNTLKEIEKCSHLLSPLQNKTEEMLYNQSVIETCKLLLAETKKNSSVVEYTSVLANMFDPHR